MSDIIPITSRKRTLAEQFWSIARGMEVDLAEPDCVKPVAVVKHVLAVLDALERGEGRTGALSINTVSFLKLLREHELRGDLSYASPEQIRGETMDERSLVFSVGVLLFERLTGRHPFGAEGNYPRRVARISKGELGSGVNYFPTVPVGLRTLLMRAMGPFPEERWASLSQLRTRLEQFVDDGAPAPRLPGTSADTSLDAHDGPTRVVRMASQFGRELMDVVDKHDSKAGPRRKRRTQPPARAAAPAPAPAARLVVPTGLVDPDPFAATVQVNAAPEHAARREPSVVVEPLVPSPRVSIARAAAPSTARATAPVTPPARSPALDAAAEAFAIGDLRPRRSGIGSAAMWAVIGAAIASIAFYVIQSRSGSQSTASSSTAAITGEVQPSSSFGSSDTNSDDNTAVDGDGDDDTGGDVDTARAEAPEPAKFAPQLGGEHAARVAATCLSAQKLQHGFTFRVGLLFAADSGAVSKTYFGHDDQMTAQEHSCMSKAFADVVAGAAPAKATVVDYRVRVSNAEQTAQIVHK